MKEFREQGTPLDVLPWHLKELDREGRVNILVAKIK
jgi:hypothetical protein